MSTPPTLLLVTGEASGDLHARHIITHVKQHDPTIRLYAMGGEPLKEAGAHLLVDTRNLNIMGFVEVLAKLIPIRRAFKKLLHFVQTESPDLVVLVDYPGFNLKLAKAIKKKKPNTKILYYISPQIWAWRYGRIHHIKKVIDMMAVIFPFEVPLYEKENIPVCFVGHPLAKHVMVSEKKVFPSAKVKNPTIGLMPGSRKSEIAKHLPLLRETALHLYQHFPNVRFVLPIASSLTQDAFTPYLRELPFEIELITETPYDALSLCDSVIVASGTATLELSLLNKPMVIIYRASRISFLIAKWLVKIPYVGLCNIIAQKKIVPELLQAAAKKETISNEVIRQVTDTPYRSQMIAALKQVESALSEKGHMTIEALVLTHLLQAWQTSHGR